MAIRVKIGNIDYTDRLDDYDDWLITATQMIGRHKDYPGVKIISEPKKPNPNDTWGKNVCIHSDLSIHPKSKPPKRSKWHNIESDPLGVCNTNVLVMTKEYPGEPVSAFMSALDGSFHLRGATSIKVTATHWRKLPKLPKEKASKE